MGKRQSELCCPTDIRQTYRWLCGEDAVFSHPCCPDHPYHGYKPTCWSEWPTAASEWRDGYCGVTCEPSATNNYEHVAPGAATGQHANEWEQEGILFDQPEVIDQDGAVELEPPVTDSSANDTGFSQRESLIRVVRHEQELNQKHEYVAAVPTNDLRHPIGAAPVVPARLPATGSSPFEPIVQSQIRTVPAEPEKPSFSPVVFGAD